MGTITVTVDLDSPDHAEIKVEGVKGKRCKDLTREIERIGKVKSDKATSEMKEMPTGHGNKLRSK